jgi:roundabout axon guidance receptor 2
MLPEETVRKKYVEGFYIRYRDMSGGSQKFNMKTVLNSEQTESHVISNLMKFTEYEVFLMPFYQKMEGQPSNSLHVQTLEDVPSAPPGNLHADMLNATSAVLKWSPPPPQHRNGVLLGYQIHVKGNGSAFHSNLTLNATTTQYVLTNLSLNQEYSLRSVAFTKIGLGPFSPPAALVMDPAHLKLDASENGLGGHGERHSVQIGDVVSEPWFIALVTSVVLVILVIFVGIVVYRRHFSGRKLSTPLQHYEDLTRLNPSHATGRLDTVWMNGGAAGWKEKEQQQHNSLHYATGNATGHHDLFQPQQSLYAEVGEVVNVYNNNGLLTTFNGPPGRHGDPAPYATTTLAMQNRTRTVVSWF